MREEVQESKKVQWFPWSLGPKVPGSQGPRYLKLRFKYELDSKEGPSYLHYISSTKYCLYIMIKQKLHLFLGSFVIRGAQSFSIPGFFENILILYLKYSFAIFLFSSMPITQSNGVPQELTKKQRRVLNLLMNKNIIKVVTVSSIQLNMLNFMETRFLFFLLFLTRLLSPGTLISCLLLNL